MPVFRYNTTGTWFKGNTHLHSTVSDGGKDFRELADLYHAAGYNFLFRTDHWAAADCARDKASYPLLWIDGTELDGQDAAGVFYHVVCLGKISGLRREDGFETGLRLARAQGALTILAHPVWCGNTLEDWARWQFDGVEVYNHVCHWLNGKSSGLAHWNAALARDPRVLAIAADDGHLRPEHPGWNGGWIVVNAPECTAPSILTAIRSGNFYSSCGPEIHSLTFDGTEVHIKTSPVRFVRLAGPAWQGDRRGSFDGPLLTTISLPLPADWPYMYLELEDQDGRRAWTNNLFA